MYLKRQRKLPPETCSELFAPFQDKASERESTPILQHVIDQLRDDRKTLNAIWRSMPAKDHRRTYYYIALVKSLEATDAGRKFIIGFLESQSESAANQHSDAKERLERRDQILEKVLDEELALSDEQDRSAIKYAYKTPVDERDIRQRQLIATQPRIAKLSHQTLPSYAEDKENRACLIEDAFDTRKKQVKEKIDSVLEKLPEDQREHFEEAVMQPVRDNLSSEHRELLRDNAHLAERIRSLYKQWQELANQSQQIATDIRHNQFAQELGELEKPDNHATPNVGLEDHEILSVVRHFGENTNQMATGWKTTLFQRCDEIIRHLHTFVPAQSLAIALDILRNVETGLHPRSKASLGHWNSIRRTLQDQCVELEQLDEEQRWFRKKPTAEEIWKKPLESIFRSVKDLERTQNLGEKSSDPIGVIRKLSQCFSRSILSLAESENISLNRIQHLRIDNLLEQNLTGNFTWHTSLRKQRDRASSRLASDDIKTMVLVIVVIVGFTILAVVGRSLFDNRAITDEAAQTDTEDSNSDLQNTDEPPDEPENTQPGETNDNPAGEPSETVGGNRSPPDFPEARAMLDMASGESIIIADLGNMALETENVLSIHGPNVSVFALTASSDELKITEPFEAHITIREGKVLLESDHSEREKNGVPEKLHLCVLEIPMKSRDSVFVSFTKPDRKTFVLSKGKADLKLDGFDPNALGLGSGWMQPDNDKASPIDRKSKQKTTSYVSGSWRITLKMTPPRQLQLSVVPKSQTSEADIKELQNELMAIKDALVGLDVTEDYLQSIKRLARGSRYENKGDAFWKKGGRGGTDPNIKKALIAMAEKREEVIENILRNQVMAPSGRVSLRIVRYVKSNDNQFNIVVPVLEPEPQP